MKAERLPRMKSKNRSLLLTIIIVILIYLAGLVVSYICSYIITWITFPKQERLNTPHQ